MTIYIPIEFLARLCSIILLVESTITLLLVNYAKKTGEAARITWILYTQVLLLYAAPIAAIIVTCYAFSK